MLNIGKENVIVKFVHGIISGILDIRISGYVLTLRKVIHFYWLRLYVSSVYGQLALYNNRTLFILLLVVLFDVTSGDIVSYLSDGQEVVVASSDKIILNPGNPGDDDAISAVSRGGSIRSAGHSHLMIDRAGSDGYPGRADSGTSWSLAETVAIIVTSVAIGFLFGRKF
jgi:hypothetical protein